MCQEQGAGSREEVTTFPAAWGHDARDVNYLQAEYLHCTQQPHTALHCTLTSVATDY